MSNSACHYQREAVVRRLVSFNLKDTCSVNRIKETGGLSPKTNKRNVEQHNTA